MTDKIDLALTRIKETYIKARTKHAPMRGPHEGYAVILEELDELWDEVKKWQPEPSAALEITYTRQSSEAEKQWAKYNENMRDMTKEARHTAAMCLAFLLEVCADH